MDIERRIAQVYQTCRNTDEINTAFDRLQAELDEQIQARMAQTRQTLLENFDEDVSARLRVHRDRTLETLGERERWLLELTRTELDGQARFEPARPRFEYPTRAKGGITRLERGRETAIPSPAGPPLASTSSSRRWPRLPTAALPDYAGHGQVVASSSPMGASAGWSSQAHGQSLDTENS